MMWGFEKRKKFTETGHPGNYRIFVLQAFNKSYVRVKIKKLISGHSNHHPLLGWLCLQISIANEAI